MLYTFTSTAVTSRDCPHPEPGLPQAPWLGPGGPEWPPLSPQSVGQADGAVQQKLPAGTSDVGSQSKGRK